MDDATLIFQHGPLGGWTRFMRPLEVIVAHEAGEMQPALQTIDAHAREGRWAAGYLAYEAAAGLDPAFKTHAANGVEPLLWFGIYAGHEPWTMPGVQDAEPFRFDAWRPGIASEEYAAQIGRIRELIADGETYQVNFSYMLESQFEGNAQAMFAALWGMQRGGYAALIQTGERTIASFSPELFFEQRGDAVITRPMKGTVARGRWAAEDRAAAAALTANVKERAENLMIVDLLRNDLGRIARPGSVATGPLFEAERYPTLWQMTSTVRAMTAGDPTDTLQALFPCGSITGAPKINTMRIIAELEQQPRGVYTGAIGWIGPERHAAFNVAIRTIEIAAEGHARYGVGGGVTWDSTPHGEWEETRTKALLLLQPPAVFELLETLRWTPRQGYNLLERHLARLEASAHYFGFKFARESAEQALEQAAREWTGVDDRRVRLLCAAPGVMRVESNFLSAWGTDGKDARWRTGFASVPVDSRNIFLFHKTTRRTVYDAARAEHPEWNEVILWNERGEVTEGTFTNIVVEIEGVKWTPPVQCGLLAGTLRAELLERGEIAERILTKQDLRRARRSWFINSLRGWVEAELDDPAG